MMNGHALEFLLFLRALELAQHFVILSPDKMMAPILQAFDSLSR